MANEVVKTLPQELNKFSWGAFLWSWIWGLTYRRPITLIIIPVSLIPVIGALAVLGLCIWFGIKGNAWAWAAKEWESVEKFNEVQKKWVVAWFILTAVCFVLGIVLGVLSGIMKSV